MTSTTPVRIDPRIRERRIEVTREAGRRRLRIALVVTSVFVVLGLAYLTVESPLLDVDRVEVTGAIHAPAQDVVRAAGVEPGRALLRVDTAAVARRVERLPWVERAEVHRDLPGTVRITVSEFRTAAFVRAGGGAALLVADDGHVIAHVRSVPAGVVEVVGVRRVPAVGELLSPPDAPGAVAHLPARLRAQVRAIDLGGEGVALRLAAGGVVRLGPLDDLDAKGAAALAVLDRLAGRGFSYIDVRVPSAPVAGGVDD
jgi:cell division protein FtsQ